MSEPRKALSQVLAEDLMHSNVITVNGNWGVSALARFFIAKKISGAPVIDDEGKVIGVVTSTDVVEFENISQQEKVEITRSTYFEEVIGEQLNEETLRELSLHANENCLTESIMTPEIISVYAKDSIIQIAELMNSRHIHRVFVVDDYNKIIGVISTMDILEYLGSL